MTKAYDSLKLTRGKISFQKEELGEFRWGKKFGQKFVFEQKFARKTLFPWEYYNDWNSHQGFRLVPTILHLSAAKSEKFCFSILKKWRTFGRAEWDLALQLENTIKHFDSPKT
jgi:hypothetical protein